MFQQAIEKQLNKGEGANKFSKAIPFGHNKEFIQSEKEDQEIAEGCRRLIKNESYVGITCISRTNLQQKKMKSVGRIWVEAIRNGSAITWKHFNLHG